MFSFLGRFFKGLFKLIVAVLITAVIGLSGGYFAFTLFWKAKPNRCPTAAEFEQFLSLAARGDRLVVNTAKVAGDVTCDDVWVVAQVRQNGTGTKEAAILRYSYGDWLFITKTDACHQAPAKIKNAIPC